MTLPVHATARPHGTVVYRLHTETQPKPLHVPGVTDGGTVPAAVVRGLILLDRGLDPFRNTMVLSRDCSAPGHVLADDDPIAAGDALVARRMPRVCTAEDRRAMQDLQLASRTKRQRQELEHRLAVVPDTVRAGLASGNEDDRLAATVEYLRLTDAHTLDMSTAPAQAVAAAARIDAGRARAPRRQPVVVPARAVPRGVHPSVYGAAQERPVGPKFCKPHNQAFRLPNA